MALQNVRYAGFAADPNGTLPQPTFYVDASEVGLDAPTDTEMEVASSVGMTARAKRPGPYIPTGNVVYQSDIRTIGYFKKWGLGGYAFTAGPPVSATDPTKTNFDLHEIWANDDRYFDPFCARIGKDEFEDVFGGCAVTGIEFSAEREFVPFTVNVNASTHQTGALKSVAADIMPNLPDEFALAYHDVNFFIDEDSAATPIDVSDLTMSLTVGFDNNVDSERGITIGSRYSRRHGSSGRSFTLSANMQFESMAQREAFWGSATGPTDQGAKVFPIRVKIDSGAVFGQADNYGECEILFPRCYFNAVPLAYSGREEMSQQVGITVQTGEVTLADGVTKIATPMYSKLRNTLGTAM